MERPSQRLIAKRLGISVASVSLGLRGTGNVSKKLSEEIRAVAEEMGYRPNPLLASLGAKQYRDNNVIGGAPIVALSLMRGPTYDRFLEERAKELGYNLSIIRPADLYQYANLTNTLANRGVEGLVVAGRFPSSRTLNEFEWDKFSIVKCGGDTDALPFNAVGPNILASCISAFRKAKTLGYRRIGFAIGKLDQITEHDFVRFLAATGLSNLEADEPERVPPYTDHRQDHKALIGWFRKHRPDCVVGFHAGLCWALLEAGIKIPEEVGFASLHTFEGNCLRDPLELSVAGMNQNWKEIARQSINQLDQQIRYHLKGFTDNPNEVLIPSYWQDGDTLPQKGSKESEPSQ